MDGTDEIAIKVDHVSKAFKLPHEKQTSIKGALINLVSSGKRTYEKQQVLKDVSFEINRGEFFGIVGRNGSGKSTLLKMLAGIYTPTKGTIEVNGKLTPFIELGVGFNPELTGRENVFLNGALLGFSRKEMEAMYDDIVSFAELEKFMDQKLKNYSSGMQVRLAFSIAIRADTDILILDEVLAVGDAAFQRKCYEHFMALKRNKKTVVLVTHDMGAVRQYCDRAIMIEQGVMTNEGSPDTVAQAYQRLFSEETKKEDAASGEAKVAADRWGSGDIVAQTTRASVDEEFVTLKTSFRGVTDTPPPIYGFTVYNSAGVNILEGNTQRLRVKTKELKKNEKIQYVWRIPNIFADGSYSVSVAVCDQSATRFYDWLNGAASFAIRKETATAGAVDPIITLNNDIGR